ncbi:MAG: AAA family ATPase [Candidatus Thermoplasmatota archaeon]|nr:AAA family ATPase [Candidatus Thermoplasmatota archaeon]
MDTHTIIGPPGTGKTRKIEHIIRENGISDYLYLVYNVGMAQGARARIEDDRKKIGTIHSIMAQKNLAGGFIKDSELLEFARMYGMSAPKKTISASGETDLERFLRYYDLVVNMMRKPFQPMDERMSMPYLYDVYEKWKEKQGRWDYTDILREAAQHTYYTETLFIDEAQDLSPLMWKIVDNISCNERYIVGDPHQSINSFRGVRVQDFTGRMKNVDTLRESYRFGDNVRVLADRILGSAKIVSADYRGLGESQIGLNSMQTFVRLEGSKAILCRTNALAGYVANRIPFAMVPISPEHSYGNGWTKTTFKVAGIMRKWPNVQPDEFRYIVEHSPADLWVRGTKARVKKEATLFSYDLMAKKIGAAEIIQKMRIDLKVRENAMKMLTKDIPVIQVDTIHASKGLEWEHVMVMTDFPSKMEITDEERRLFYVASTRARKTLDFQYAGFYSSSFHIPGHAEILNPLSY